MRLSYKRCVEQGAKLIVSAALVMPLLACYPKDIHTTYPRTAMTEVRKDPGKPLTDGHQMRYSNGKVECSINSGSFEYRFSDGTGKTIDRMLEPNERVNGLSCSDSNAFVLTDASLITVPGKAAAASSGISLNLSFIRTDLKDMYAKGLIAWAASDDRCFFLTKGNEIKEMPIEGDSLIHSIPHDMRNATMIFHSGFLFIAPAETDGRKYVVAMRFSDKARFRGMELAGGDSGQLIVRQGKLFFGKTEIKISGQNLADVRLEKKE
jgi:hypothetical protein